MNKNYKIRRIMLIYGYNKCKVLNKRFVIPRVEPNRWDYDTKEQFESQQRLYNMYTKRFRKTNLLHSESYSEDQLVCFLFFIILFNKSYISK